MGQKRVQTRPPVMKYLTDHAGQLVHLQDIVDATGLTINQVQNAIGNARRESEMWSRTIEVITAGQTWRYRDVTTGSGRMFEEVRVTKSGVLIIEDEEGRLYQARELT